MSRFISACILAPAPQHFSVSITPSLKNLVVMKWTRPLCGSAAMSQNDFKTSEIIEPQEASPHEEA